MLAAAMRKKLDLYILSCTPFSSTVVPKHLLLDPFGLRSNPLFITAEQREVKGFQYCYQLLQS